MLDQQDKEWIEARYVKKDDCTENMAAVDKKFSNDDTRIKLFEQKLGHWEKLFGVIAAATVGQLIATLFGILGGG